VQIANEFRLRGDEGAAKAVEWCLRDRGSTTEALTELNETLKALRSRHSVLSRESRLRLHELQRLIDERVELRR
jgi:hypothetical protein